MWIGYCHKNNVHVLKYGETGNIKHRSIGHKSEQKSGNYILQVSCGTHATNNLEKTIEKFTFKLRSRLNIGKDSFNKEIFVCRNLADLQEIVGKIIKACNSDYFKAYIKDIRVADCIIDNIMLLKYDIVRLMKNENSIVCCYKIFILVILEMYPLEYRKAVLQLYNYFNSMRKTALALKVSIATISRWSKSLEPKKYVRQNTKTSDALKSFILLKLSKKPYMTCKEICTLIYQHFNFNVSRQLVHLILKQSNMTYKRIRKRGASKHKEDRIKNFVKQIKEIPKDSLIISIDSVNENLYIYFVLR